MVAGLLAFLPQMFTILVCALWLGRDLPLSLFVQTVIFVVFNKVSTAQVQCHRSSTDSSLLMHCCVQYFAWYFSILPLVLPSSRMSIFRGIALFGLWFAGELHWLYWAYMLEMQSRNTFVMIWTAGIAFFWINVYILAEIIGFHRFRPSLDAVQASTKA